jgi:hypothetical protein
VKTLTDFGSGRMISFSFEPFAEIGFDLTGFGFSNVLSLSTRGAVSLSPLAKFAELTDVVSSFPTARIGSMLEIASHSLLSRSFAATFT